MPRKDSGSRDAVKTTQRPSVDYFVCLGYFKWSTCAIRAHRLLSTTYKSVLKWLIIQAIKFSSAFVGAFVGFFLYLSVISMFELDCVFIVRFLQRHILSEWQFPLQHFLRVTFDLVTFSPLYFVRDLINLWCILQHWYKWSFFMWRVPGHWNSFRSGLGRGNVRTPSIAVVFAISYGWDAVSGNLSKSACFEGVGHFERKFQTEGALPTKHCWCQKTRVIALSCGIKISAVHCLVLSQNTRVTDRRTDRITTPTTALTRSRGKIQYRYSYRRKYQPRICE